MLHEKRISIFILLYLSQQLLALNILLVPYYKQETYLPLFLVPFTETKKKKRTKEKVLMTLLFPVLLMGVKESKEQNVGSDVKAFEVASS